MDEIAPAQRVAILCKVDDLTTPGWVERRDLAKSERFQRAGKIFMVFFAVALLTVFVPVLHFILPPLSLIIGTTLAMNEYACTGEIVRGEVSCPNCKTKMNLPNETESWPRTQRCSNCSFTLTIDREK